MLYIIILIKKNPAWKDFVHINKFYDIIYLYVILIKVYAISQVIHCLPHRRDLQRYRYVLYYY